MIGPDLGTFSPPMTRSSVKNESTAKPAAPRIRRCKTLYSVMGREKVLGVFKKEAASRGFYCLSGLTSGKLYKPLSPVESWSSPISISLTISLEPPFFLFPHSFGR